MHKLLNIVRAELSYALSLLGIVRVRHLPTFVSVEPANFCQLRCPECPVGNGGGNRPKALLTLEQFQRILEQVKGYAHTMQFYFQGEPLLNKNLPTMIEQAHQAGLYTIVSTNALAVTPLFATQLIGAYRVGGSLHKALEGLSFLRQAKEQTGNRTHIELQMLRLRTNEHEWDAISHRYQVIGADSLTLKTAQLYNYEHGHPLMPTNKRYSRYVLGKDGLYHPKHSSGRSCHRLWTGCVITVSGEVLPCCYDKASSFSFGNIYHDDLATIYHGEKANRFRQSVLGKRSKPAICNNCVR